MTTAQVIVEAGYARATSNDPGKLASDGELLGRLNRVFQAIYALAARQRPGSFTSTATLTLAGTPATALLTAATPALTDVIDIRLVYGVSGTVAAGGRIHLIDEMEAFRTYQITPAVFRRGLSIVSKGAAGDPANTDVIGLTVLDAPATLAALSTNIDARFPVRHHEVLSNDIAAYLDLKDGGKRQAGLMADQKLKLQAFAQEFNVEASALEAVFTTRVPLAGE